MAAHTLVALSSRNGGMAAASPSFAQQLRLFESCSRELRLDDAHELLAPHTPPSSCLPPYLLDHELLVLQSSLPTMRTPLCRLPNGGVPTFSSSPPCAYRLPPGERRYPSRVRPRARALLFSAVFLACCVLCVRHDDSARARRYALRRARFSCPARCNWHTRASPRGRLACLRAAF